MRAREFITDRKEERLDELLPLIATAGGALARGAVAGGTALARGAGALGTKVAQGAQQVGTKVAQGAQQVGTKVAQGAQQVGTKVAQGAQQVGTKVAQGAQTALKQPQGFNYNAAAKMAGVKPVVPKGQQVGQNKPPVPGTSVTTPNADIGTQSSTGGQTFNTPTGTVHRANPNNPNNAQAPISQTPNTKAISGPGAIGVKDSPAVLPPPKDNANYKSPIDPTGEKYKTWLANNPDNIAGNTPSTTNIASAPTTGAATVPPTSAKAAAAVAMAAATRASAQRAAAATTGAKAAPAAAATLAAPTTAPSLGPPAAVQAQQTKQAQAPSSNKSTGFLAGLSKGFTTGMGGREGETLTQLAARKAAGGLGLNATSQALGDMPKAGTSVNDPKLGKLTVQPTDAKHPDMVSVKTADGRTIFMDPNSL